MVLYMNYATTCNERNTTMPSEDKNAQIWAKIILSVFKAVPSAIIDIGLAEQERVAQKEQRLNDLGLIRSAIKVKQEVDSALDEWIINL